VSLFKQIQLLVTLLLLVTLIIVLRINFTNTHEFTIHQSFTNTKNVANVLALSLSSRESDEAFIQTSINAMFDGGYYEFITLIDTNGDVIYKKSEDLAVLDVPRFFINRIHMTTPVAEAQVMNGWSRSGILQVKGHSGPAYKILWETFKQLCVLFVMLGGMAILVSYFALRHLLKALNKIQNQAEAISQNEFIVNETIPNTPELKKVVLAMNIMVEKVQTIFNRHLDNLIQFQEFRHTDAITGLYNRSFFVKQLSEYIENKGVSNYGQVIILGLTGMEKMDISGGVPLVHKVFKDLAEHLRKATFDVENSVVARFPRREFALILPGCKPEKGMRIAETVICEFLISLEKESGISEPIGVYGGISSFSSSDDLSTVLSKADYALSVARTGLQGSVETFIDDQDNAVLGKSEWKDLIEDAFSKNRFILTAQPVLSNRGELHNEVFVNLVDEKGEHLLAGLFMPMVMANGLSNKLDKYVLEHSVRFLLKHPENVLSVNITTEFCQDRLMLPWLRQFLTKHKHLHDKLFFEIHENTFIRYPEIGIDFTGLITGLGFKFGIDQYTMSDASLNLLNRIKPSYIKIERDYLEVFDDPEKADMVLNALFTISDSLNIRLIATKIENEDQRNALTDKNINYFQGHGISSVAPLKEFK